MKEIGEIPSRLADTMLADEPVYEDQTFGDGIDCQKKTFKSNGAEQSGTIGGYEALSSDFVAVQSQPCFCHGPNVALPASDHHTLRPSGFQLEPLRQRAGYHAECRAGVYEQLNFFNASPWTGQMTLYVEQSHIKNPAKNTAIVAQPKNNAITLISPNNKANPPELPVEHRSKFDLFGNLKTAVQISLTVPPNVLGRADMVIR